MIQQTRVKMDPPLERKDLAQKCNMTVPTLALWENGTATPDQDKFNKLERVLNVNLRGGKDKFGTPKFAPKNKK